MEVTTGQSSHLPAPPPERWLAWFGRHKVLTALVVLLVGVIVALDAWVLTRRHRYLDEIARLRSSMSQLERERTDQLLAREESKLRLAIAMIQRQARVERALHLSVALDSGSMFLERDGAMLREMPVQVGSERSVGVAPDTVRLAAPRGVRTVASVVHDTTAWEIPAWVYADRGLEAPPQRALVGALGTAVILEGGAIIYSQPAVGPLADSAYVLPGAIRARHADLRAILPNITPGTRVYIY